VSVWNKVKEGIDKAGKVAQDALDEGKTRLSAYRAREQADKAAEALGYALFRAHEAAKELDAESSDRLMQSLRDRDTEARRLEAELAHETKSANEASPTDAAPPSAPPAPPSPAAAPEAAAHFTAPPAQL
jgi:hypothetical protein